MVAASVVDSQFSSGNLGALTLPATPPTWGQVYLAIVWGDSDATASMTSSGNNTWSDVSAGYGSNGTQGTSIFKSMCIGDGQDQGSVTSPKARFARLILLDGADVAGIIAAYGTTNTLNPPPLTLPGSADWRFFAAARTNSSSLAAGPSGYSNFQVGNYLGIVYGGTMTRAATTAGPEDPSTFAGTASAAHSVTIAVPPAPPPRTSGAVMAYAMQHHRDELATRRQDRGWKRRESGIYCRGAA